MKPPDFQLAREIFAAACDAPKEEREALIRERAGGNDGVVQLVLSLLEEDERGGLDLPGDDAMPSSSAPMPTRVGPYRILRVCGRGGMGLVYEAEQDSPRRRVAIKMIRAAAMSDEVLRRFRYESEILGRLQHPGIGQIFEAGSIDVGEGEQPFFAMEFIEGLTLLEFARRHDLSIPARLELMARVCDAVHYAHQRGVVHRDLKPENIIVAAESSSSHLRDLDRVVGQPKILDFGIARATDADVHVTTLRTHAGQLIGTLQYMSPEQASGRASNVDTRSDIYALGVLLFELVSGRVPYDLAGASIPDALRTIQEQAPERMSGVDSRYRGDVETIARKCLEKEPERRYASASELAEDLRRHLRDEPIVARPPSAIYQWRKFVARNRALVGGVVATLLTLVGGVVIATVYAVRADASADAARRESYRASLVAANAVLLEDPRAATRYLDAAPADLRGWEWHYLRSRHDRHVLTFDDTRGQGPSVGDSALLEFDAAGGRLFAASVASGAGNAIGVWDARTGRYLHSLTFDDTVTAFDIGGGDVERVAVGTASGRVFVVELEGGERTEVTLPAPARSRVVSLEWDRAAARLAVGTETAVVLVGGEEVRVLSEGRCTLDGLAFDADGSRLYAITRARFGSLFVFDTGTAELLIATSVDGVPEDIVGVALDEGRGRVLIGTIHRLIVALDMTSLERLHHLTGHHHAVSSLDHHAETDRLATSGADGTIRVWRDTECVAVLRAERGVGAGVSTVAFTPDGSALAYVDGGRVRLWNPSVGRSTVLGEHDTYVYYIAFSPDGSRLASGSYHGAQTFLWDPIRLVRMAEVGVATAELGFTTDGRLITSAGVHDATSGARLGALGPHDEWNPLSSNRAWNAARTCCVSGHEPNSLPFTVLDASGELVFEIPGRMWGAAFDPTSSLLATCDDMGSVQLWDATTGTLERTLEPGAGPVYSVAFHPDGSRLAVGANDGTIRLFDTSTWEQVHELRGHTSYVKAIEFSPDGTQLASGSGDATVRLWDTVSPSERARRRGDGRGAVPYSAGVPR